VRARTLLLFIILVGTLTLTPVAMAQTAAEDAYNRDSLGVVGEIQTEEPGNGREITPEPPTQQREGDLPFTGLELGGIALAGVLLLGSGVALRRRLATDS
jgi:hypothetical protein